MAIINPDYPVCDYGGTGRDLLFLHANGYPPDCYLPLLKKISERYHTFAIKMRPLWDAHGADTLQNWQLLSDDLNQFLNHNHNRPIIAMGHSLGAVVGLRSALQKPLHFRALILLDPVIFPPAMIRGWQILVKLGLGYQVHPLIPAAKKRRRVFADLDAVFAAYRPKKNFRYISDENLKIMIEGMVRRTDGNQYELIYSPEWEVRIYYSGVSIDLDIWKSLPKMEIPVLILRGAETNTFLPVTAWRVKRTLPSARIVTLKKSTHLVPLEKPEESAAMIMEFLENVT
jgi:pimeloyl-ACP methyl ester carboxylesterase